MSVLAALRENRLMGPTDLGFDANQWIADADKHSDGSEVDAFLLAITPLFAESFRWLRGLFSEIVNKSAPTSVRAHALTAIANRECVLAVQHARTTPVRSAAGAPAVSMDHMAPQRIKLAGGAFSADEIAQTTIDIAETMLRMLRHYPAQPEASAQATLAAVAKDVRTGSAYATVDHLWLDVLWNGFALDPSNTRPVFVARQSEQLKRNAVMWHRYWMLTSQGFVMMFAEALHAARLGRLPHDPLPGLRIDASQSPGQFDVEDASADLMADRLARRLSGIPDYYEPYLASASPANAQLSLALVFNAYLFLTGAIRAEWERLEQALEQETQQEAAIPVEAYTPPLSRASLIAAFAKGLSVSPSVAQSLFDFFAFDPAGRGRGTKSDLWSAPFVALDSDRFAIALHSIHMGNVSWLVDIWLRRLGFQLDDRGNRFESYARDELRKAASKSRLSSITDIHPHAMKFDGEEIDCVLCVGNTLVIAEVKCFLLPVSPVDRQNHERKVRDAAAQAKRKGAFVQTRIDAFLKRARKCGMNLPASPDVHAAVVLNNAIGAGQVIDDIPVVDLLIVERYFDGTLQRLASIGLNGIHAQHVVRFWETPEQAGPALSGYLRQPPQVAPIKAAIVERELQIPMPGFPADTVYSVQYSVDADILLNAAAHEAVQSGATDASL